jgi:hypothetical protein
VAAAGTHVRHERLDMGDTSLIRTALLVALITAFGLAAAGLAPAAEAPVHAEAPSVALVD